MQHMKQRCTKFLFKARALTTLEQDICLIILCWILTSAFPTPLFSPTVHMVGWLYVCWMHQHEILQMATSLNTCEAVITVF